MQTMCSSDPARQVRFGIKKIYRKFEGQLFKLETLREYSFGKVTRVLTLKDVQ